MSIFSESYPRQVQTRSRWLTSPYFTIQRFNGAVCDDAGGDFETSESAGAGAVDDTGPGRTEETVPATCTNGRSQQMARGIPPVLGRIFPGAGCPAGGNEDEGASAHRFLIAFSACVS